MSHKKEKNAYMGLYKQNACMVIENCNLHTNGRLQGKTINDTYYIREYISISKAAENSVKERCSTKTMPL